MDGLAGADLEYLPAVVLGRGVYMGHWLGPARDCIRHNTSALAARPVWAFGSGPLGDLDAGDGQHLPDAALAAGFGPVDDRIFAGRLDRHALGLAERAVMAVVRADDEDDRDWKAITSWADGMATLLRAGAAPQVTGPQAAR